MSLQPTNHPVFPILACSLPKCWLTLLSKHTFVFWYSELQAQQHKAPIVVTSVVRQWKRGSRRKIEEAENDINVQEQSSGWLFGKTAIASVKVPISWSLGLLQKEKNDPDSGGHKWDKSVPPSTLLPRISYNICNNPHYLEKHSTQSSHPAPVSMLAKTNLRLIPLPSSHL